MTFNLRPFKGIKARRAVLRIAIGLLSLPAHIFWLCAAWRSRLDTTLANELADDGNAVERF
jgi:hypothetical protein